MARAVLLARATIKTHFHLNLILFNCQIIFKVSLGNF